MRTGAGGWARIGGLRIEKGSGVITAAFLDKGATSPSPPLSSWWMLMLARLRSDATIELDITAPPQNDRLPQNGTDLSVAAPFKHQTSSVAPMMERGGRFLWWHRHRPSAPRPPPICLTPLHAWPFLWGGCQFLVTLSWCLLLKFIANEWDASLGHNGATGFFLTWWADKLGQAVPYSERWRTKMGGLVQEL